MKTSQWVFSPRTISRVTVALKVNHYFLLKIISPPPPRDNKCPHADIGDINGSCNNLVTVVGFELRICNNKKNNKFYFTSEWNGSSFPPQGLMFGYATDETEECMPLTILLAHKLNHKLKQLSVNGDCPWILPDSKSQVSYCCRKILADLSLFLDPVWVYKLIKCSLLMLA